jgi:streptogramin lyase
MTTTAAAKKKELVTVTIGVTDPNTGDSQTVEATIPGGPTPVPELKATLQIAPDSSLWVIKNGRKKVLADHEKHNVKAGDHFEAISKGGIS